MRPIRTFTTSILVIGLLSGSTAGVLAQDDSSAEDRAAVQAGQLLPGVNLETEGVEPGVFRVVGDGVREFSRPVELGRSRYWWGPPGELYRRDALEGGDIVANEDGVWLRQPEAIVRVGDDEALWVRDENKDESPRFQVAPDGRLFDPNRQRVLRDGEWQSVKFRANRTGVDDINSIIYADDGSVWVFGRGDKDDDRRQRVARRDDDGWTRIELPPTPAAWKQEQRKRVKEGRPSRRPPNVDQWRLTPDGTLYARRGRDVQRFDGTEWETLERPGKNIQRLQVAQDGSVWATTELAGGEWYERQVTRVDVEGGPTIEYEWQPFFDEARVGVDGAYWVPLVGDPMATGACAGIARMDGTTTRTYLEDMCIYDVSVGPDGNVWLEAGTWDGNYWLPDAVGPVEVFVIEAGAEGVAA